MDLMHPSNDSGWADATNKMKSMKAIAVISSVFFPKDVLFHKTEENGT